ncbi:MAG: malto-oligosyltrehalose trehalohydrolase [Endomicrobiales bacterium]|nr:malto-oligosyltrehalose trehalohydrolase [Endomicrobiales bacterium]
MKIGARLKKDKTCLFSVWAPLLEHVELVLLKPNKKYIPMLRDDLGYWSVRAEDISDGTPYMYRLNRSEERPDPASHYQISTVHGPSAVVDHTSFEWEDKQWKTIQLEQMIIYELHIGTFTKKGTFSAVINKLEYLKKLGINTIEIMPVAQFPGNRNWGYDAAYPFAVQNSYGGPSGLKKLVNACHKKNIAVILDVVYNHLGPEGNYLERYAPYFTKKYRTPWGKAINYDDTYSYGVRNYMLENMLYWFENYHIDALRIDAIHGIFDMSPKHILKELAEVSSDYSKRVNKKHYLIAESDLNNRIIVDNIRKNGYGIDSQWSDDFHHSVHALLTKEKNGYYADFGDINDLAKALECGFVYSGEYSVFRKKRHGNSASDLDPAKFVVFMQNHDQVGNRLSGDRLSAIVPFEALKLAAGILLVSPYIPLLFMGEEYGETAPFPYFISHGDQRLAKAVRKGREKEFKTFNWKGRIPDPQDKRTFFSSQLNWNISKPLFRYYKRMIALRKKYFTAIKRKDIKVYINVEKKILELRTSKKNAELLVLLNPNTISVKNSCKLNNKRYTKLIDSYECRWGGTGSRLPGVLSYGDEYELMPYEFAVYKKR